jgi:hypothetical protein
MLVRPPWYLRLYLTYRVIIGRQHDPLPDWYFRRLLWAARYEVARRSRKSPKYPAVKVGSNDD